MKTLRTNTVGVLVDALEKFPRDYVFTISADDDEYREEHGQMPDFLWLEVHPLGNPEAAGIAAVRSPQNYSHVSGDALVIYTEVYRDPATFVFVATAGEKVQ